MAKRTDHVQRRAALAAAVWSLIRKEGVSALSIRKVAREAGWTTGNVQHYFSSKDALLCHAFELVQDEAIRRVEAAAAEQPPEEAHIAALEVFLPLTPETRAGIEVWFTFFGLALGNLELRVVAEAGYRRLTKALVEQLQRAQAAGGVDANLDLDAVALEILVLADGFSIQALFRDRSSDLEHLRDLAETRVRELVSDQRDPKSGGAPMAGGRRATLETAASRAASDAQDGRRRRGVS